MQLTRRASLKASIAGLSSAILPAILASPLAAQTRKLRWRGPDEAIVREPAIGNDCTLWQQPTGDGPEAEAMAWIAQAEETVSGRIGDNPLARAACAVDKARELAEANGLDRVRAAVANTYGNIAQLRTGADAAETARNYFREAAGIASQIGDQALFARTLINAARIELRAGELAASAAMLDAAANVASGADWAFEKIALASTYGDVAARDSAYLQPAFAAIEAAREAARVQDDLRLKSWGEGLAGDLYAAAGREDDALMLLREASRLAEAGDAPEVAYRWQWHAGQILDKRNELDAAIAAFEVARNNVDKVRLELPEFDPQTGDSLFRRTLGPIYTGLADLYLRKSNADGGSAASPRPLINARQVVEQLKAAELDDYFGDACTAALLEQSVDLENAKTPGAAVLYPILLENRTELVISLPDGTIQSAQSPVGADAIGELSEALRQSLLPPNLEYGTAGETDYIQPARDLYRYIIEPVEPFLEGVETIVFVPDGPLRNIPLAALLKGDKFLVEDYAVGTTLGLQLLQSAQIDRKESRLLFAGIADQIPNQQDFPALASVELERDRISTVVPPRQTLFDDAFKEDAIKTEITDRTFDIVHVATHGLFGARPEDSYILAWDGELNMTEFENILIQTRFRDDPIDLLTLSACKTAEGNDRAALGIAGLAVKVGARSALASLWEAVDNSTAPMMGDFYSNLVDDQDTKAIALQRAQKGLIASESDEFDFGRMPNGKVHPVYWASFIVVGSWV